MSLHLLFPLPKVNSGNTNNCHKIMMRASHCAFAIAMEVPKAKRSNIDHIDAARKIERSALVKIINIFWEHPDMRNMTAQLLKMSCK